MVKVGPRLPGPSRREIEKREKEQRRASQIENGEDLQPLGTEPYEPLESAAQRKKARHRSIDEADLEDSKRRREKTLKRREARRLAKQAERELARREGSQECVEDSLEFLLAEIDRRYNNYEHLASQTPITRSKPQRTDVGNSPVLPSTDEPMEDVTTSVYSSTNTGSDIRLPLVSPSESMMTIATIATPENPFRMQIEPSEELYAASSSTPATVSLEEPEPTLVTSNAHHHTPLYHPQGVVVASEIPAAVHQHLQDIINWLPMLQLPGSLSQTFSSTPATMPETAASNNVASGATRPMEASPSRSSLLGVDSSAAPISSEPLNTGDFSSSNPGPSSAVLTQNSQETPRPSVRGGVEIPLNDGLALNTLASFTSLASSSSVLPSVSGSSLTRASDMDLGPTAPSTSTRPPFSTVPTELSVAGLLTPQADAEEPSSSQQGGRPASESRTGSLALGVVNQSQATTSTSTGTQPMASECTTAERPAVASGSTASLPTHAIAIVSTAPNMHRKSSSNSSGSTTNSAATPAVETHHAAAAVGGRPSGDRPGGQPEANATTSLARLSPFEFSFARQVPSVATTLSASTRTQSTVLTSITSGTAQTPLAVVPIAYSPPTANTSGVSGTQSCSADVVRATPATLIGANLAAPPRPTSETDNVVPSAEGSSRLLVSKTAVAPSNVVPSSAPRLFPPTVAGFKELVRAGKRPTLGNMPVGLAPVTESTASSDTIPAGNRGQLTDDTGALNVESPSGSVILQESEIEGSNTDTYRGTFANDLAGENQPTILVFGLPASSETGENQPTPPDAGSPVATSEGASSEVDKNEPPFLQVDAPVDPCWASIPEVNLPNDEDTAIFDPASTRQRVRSDTFSSNISDSANAETTALDGRVPVPDNDGGADGVTLGTGSFSRIADSDKAGPGLPNTMLAPAAPIVDDLRRPPVPPPASGTELPRTAGIEVEPTESNIFQTATITSFVSTPNSPLSEPAYPDTPQPRSGIIPPYSTPTSQSPRIFTLELPSPRTADKTTPILPIHDPHISRKEEKRGISIVHALKWVLRKTFGYFLQRRG